MVKLILYRTYLILIALPILLIATALTAISTTLFSGVGMGRWAGSTIPRYWSRLFCVLTFVRVAVYGREHIAKSTSYVFVCNHQSAYDIFAIYGYLNYPFRWMMKKSLEKIPLVGQACKACGHILVDNSSPSATRHTMQEAEKRLSGGMSLVVFPEGARTFTGKMRPFKRGAYALAMEFSLPVVPITIDGAFDVMPRYNKLPHWGHIKLVIHPPIVADNEGHDLSALIHRSYTTIHDSLPEKFQ